MQDPKPQIEIVEYNKQYASTDQIKNFFFENYDQQMNSNSFKGVYISMRAKYGKLVYGFLIMSALQFCGVVYLILAYATEWSTITKTILSIVLGGALEYSLLGVLLVKLMNKPHIYHGYEMLSNFDDMDARYKKNGGNFWFALLSNPKTGTKELVGQLGFVKSDSPAKSAHLEALGVDTKYRGLGIGRRLMEKAINYAEEKNIENLTLGVLAVNTAGVNLYKKFGFNIVKTFEIEPLTGLSVHMMSKRLN